MSEPSPQRRYTDVRHTHLSRRASKHARRGLIIGPTTSRSSRSASNSRNCPRSSAPSSLRGWRRPAPLPPLVDDRSGARARRRVVPVGLGRTGMLRGTRFDPRSRRGKAQPWRSPCRQGRPLGRQAGGSERSCSRSRSRSHASSRSARTQPSELRHATNINRGPRSQTVGWIAPAPAPSSPAATLASA